MNIVITGSLGHIGKPLTEELVQKDHVVTVISSKPDRQEAITSLGATAAIGSLDDVDFLTATLTGADAVFAMVPPNVAETDVVIYYRRISQNYVQAIQKAGVKRVVLLSSYGAHLTQDTGFILGAHHAELLLNQLEDVAITHLRAGYFYYNLFSFIGMIKEAGLMGANYGGDDQIGLVSPADIAAVAAEELVKPATGKTIRYVVSDDRTASEIAQVLGSAIGKPDLQWLVFTSEQMREGMKQRGLPTHIIENFVELGASLHSGALLDDYNQHKPTLRKVKLEAFATEFAMVYQHQ
ncbi:MULTISPECIES: NAD(P)H-binding protein [unclassified Spirosoma]|uniref:NAD(P)H-binding protein n=1 Tax=unclassified Spirosoma TaxID=2621999 RepID=UPI00096A1950|nr:MULTISPECIES: NAD(P)H-binding protein [unclassified Spirosoma]MBN8823927.1 NAD(P)H-binding protein [Spirosoma sp.]OJW79682.1 MAG: NAD-dependent dehydratase [Spirosoma sp. 48-14]